MTQLFPFIRAYYIPDQATADWPLYFFVGLQNNQLCWELKDETDFCYNFNIPFNDSDWAVEYQVEGNWLKLLENIS